MSLGGPSDEDRRWMRHALGLGRRCQGRSWPNPAVGCVIVSGGLVVGRGWTQAGGRPHAERVALDQAGAAARGATVYVTLEPCNHTGKTPPCSEALVAAGVARVVVAARDPDPRTNGQGLATLKGAGVEITTGVLEEEANRDHAGFLFRVTIGRPWVSLKLASTLDGRIATATGESRWITGPAARRWVHLQRLTHDAVMVGAGTARADDPLLTVRGFGVVEQPVRIVVSRRLDLPRSGNLFASSSDVPLWLIHGADAPSDAVAAWAGRGAETVSVGTGAGGQIDLAAAMHVLAERGLTRIFCEGGGTFAAGLLGLDLVDEIKLVTAGLTIGAEGTPSLGGMGLAALGEAPRFELAATEVLEGDVLTTWRRTPKNV